MENNRGTWSSNFGFIMAAVGSAVGLGNIWGFPYKMGKSGGFTFLLVYLGLAIFVGMIIMASELALGRKTGSGVITAYRRVSKKFGWIGWLGYIAPFLIMTFYSVLGAYVLQYLSLNLAELAFGLGAALGTPLTGGFTFGAMLSNPAGSVIFTVGFMVICYLIVAGGVESGIEKFNKIGMPALFVMLIIIIAKAWSMPGSIEGLKFMFVPGYAVSAGFITAQPDFVTVLGTAGGQMFFSLSLAMGAMVTYGSYLNKQENITKNSVVIVVCDTIVALMAGLAVIPAAVANGIANGIPYNEISLSGPKLLFVTLQDVFANMGDLGAVFGIIFYTLVLLAAISSAISLMEAVAAHFMDKRMKAGKEPKRKLIVGYVSLAITALAALVAACALGEAGIAPANIFGQIGTDAYAMWNDCWLDFMDFFSEGIAMPLGAMLMALLVGWELKPGFLLDEINGNKKCFFSTFYSICVKFVVPVVMAFVLAGQMIDFLTPVNGAYSVKAVCYGIAGALLALFWIFAVVGKKKEA